jgi:hypothetical protein
LDKLIPEGIRVPGPRNWGISSQWTHWEREVVAAWVIGIKV